MVSTLRTKYLKESAANMRSFRYRDFAASLLLGIGLVIVTIASWSEMSEFRLWLRIDYPIPTIIPNSTLFGLVHLILGASTFVIGMYYVLEIVRVNQIAQAGKNNPTHLLTQGYYGRVRHPMTGMFIMILFGLMISLCSVISIVLIILFVLFFHGTTLYEERTWLIPKFGKEYHDYMVDVPRRYLSPTYTVYLVLLFVFSCIGIFF